MATAVTATPASGQIIDGSRYSETTTDTFTACGVDVRFTDHVDGMFKIRQHGTQSKAYLFDHFQDSTVYTNLDTGKSWRVLTIGTHVDVKIDLVSGTVYRFTWQDAGPFKVFDGNGRLAYVQAGLRRESAEVDTHGNLDLDDDDYLLQLSFELRGHYPNGDFCTDLTNFTN
ncbi:hypothetical protein ACVBEQ_10440 [Nakamurella sp. GG22]